MRILFAVIAGIALTLFDFWAIPNLLEWWKGWDLGIPWKMVVIFLFMWPLIGLTFLPIMIPMGVLVKDEPSQMNAVYVVNVSVCALLVLFALTGHGWKVRVGTAVFILLTNVHVFFSERSHQRPKVLVERDDSDIQGKEAFTAIAEHAQLLKDYHKGYEAVYGKEITMDEADEPVKPTTQEERNTIGARIRALKINDGDSKSHDG